jgi:hypothetical protein
MEKIVELVQRLKKKLAHRGYDKKTKEMRLTTELNQSNILSSDEHIIDDESNEKLLIIMNGSSGLAHYWHEFEEGMPDSQIIAGFVMAMSTFMQEVTGSAAETWKTEYGDNINLLIVKGKWTIGVLALSRTTDKTTENLKKLIEEFEDNYSTLKYSDDIKSSALNSFDDYVREVLVFDGLNERSVLMKTTEWSERIPKLERPSKSFKMMKFLDTLSSRMTIQDICKISDLSLLEVRELASLAQWYGVITTT